MQWTYGVTIAREGDSFVATARDLPEVLTIADSATQAAEQAVDALDVVVAYRIENGEALNPPSPIEAGETAVVLPLQTAAKAGLYVAWRRSGLSKSEVGRRMGIGENEVRRILSARHGTRLSAIEAAAKALGARISLTITYE